MKSPSFWQKRGGMAAVLKPAAWVYAHVAALRENSITPRAFSVPVICVGNLTMGGAGKTPLVLLLAQELRAKNCNIHVVSRGYGGRLQGPVQVDPQKHDFTEVGDEPLLIAAVAPCWVAKERVRGIEAAIAAGAEMVLLDDGLQNPTMRKDFSLVVIDGPAGFGNGFTFPAGPLREPLAKGMARADAFVLVGEDRHQLQGQLAEHAPVFTAGLTLIKNAVSNLQDKKIIAFAGIGRPEKFFGSLRQAGLTIIEEQAFADHHPYTQADIRKLMARAARKKAVLVTTEKDKVRIPLQQAADIIAVPVTLGLDKSKEILTLITSVRGENP